MCKEPFVISYPVFVYFQTLYKDSKVQSYFTDLSVKTSVFDIVVSEPIYSALLLCDIDDCFYTICCFAPLLSGPCLGYKSSFHGTSTIISCVFNHFILIQVTIVISTFYVPIKAYFVSKFQCTLIGNANVAKV